MTEGGTWDPPEAEEYYQHLQQMLVASFREAFGHRPATSKDYYVRWRRAYDATALIRKELLRVYTDHFNPVMIMTKH